MKLTQFFPAENDTTNMVDALDGGNKDVSSPNQSIHDDAIDQITNSSSTASPVYNFQTTTLSGTQKLMLYAAFFGLGYIIYKKYKK